MARRTEHRELAAESLRRFRTEITTNRDALVSRKDYHATLKKELTTLFACGGAKTSARMAGLSHTTMGVGPVFFEQAAWDVAVATQALRVLDASLAFRLSRVYTVQAGSRRGSGAAIVPVHDFRPIVDTGFRRRISLDSELYGRCVLLRSRAAQGVQTRSSQRSIEHLANNLRRSTLDSVRGASTAPVSPGGIHAWLTRVR